MSKTAGRQAQDSGAGRERSVRKGATMRIYQRGNSQYLDLGIIDGKRARLSEERLLELVQLHGLLGRKTNEVRQRKA